MMAPHLVAYAALGDGWVPTGASRAGACGLCGGQGVVWEALGVLSRRFSSWELIAVDPGTGRRHLCAGCSWALASPGDIRRACLHLDQGGAGRWRWGQVAERLQRGPLVRQEALVVPTGGRKSILPLAAWGCLASDMGALPWDRVAARASRAGAFIRAAGATERELADMSAPSGLLARLDELRRARVRAAWRVWGPWMGSQWAGVMIRTTRSEPRTDEDPDHDRQR